MNPRTKIVAEKSYRKEILEDRRPWGKFRAYPTHGARHVKIITVNPAAALSLQYHERRSEFWVVLDTGLEITVGPKVLRPAVGEEIYIPRRTPHRLRCLGRKPARVMEIWLGLSGESDIVRIEDQYGRNL